MTPQQKALIAALLDKAAKERAARNTRHFGVTQGENGVTQHPIPPAPLTSGSDADNRKVEASRQSPTGDAETNSGQDSVGAAPTQDGRKGSRHKLGQAAYMREYRKRKKAQAVGA